MVKVISRKSFLEQAKFLVTSSYFLPFAFVLLLVIALPITLFNLHKSQDIRQRAASLNKTATISVSPSSGTYTIGQQFSVDVVIDGGGQIFNAAAASIQVSSNLTVQSITITPSSSLDACNFTFVNMRKTPTIADPSFSGAILSSSSAKCTLYTLTLIATSSGVGTISIERGSIKSYADHFEIFLSATNGTYTLSSTVTPTPSATPTPSMTPTPSNIPTATPTPTSTPLEAPTFDTIPTETYNTSVTLSGTKLGIISKIYVNNSETNVTYPTTTSWQLPVVLTLGANTYTVYGQDANGYNSSTNTLTINLHKEADITGDGVVDLTDLSLFGSDYENTGTLNNALSDINGDGVVDLTDFSILAKNYGG